MSIQAINSSGPGAVTVVPSQVAKHAPQHATVASTTSTQNVTQASSTQEASKGTKTPTAEEVQDAVKELQKAVAPLAQELQFSIDKDTGRTLVKIMDTATDKVVRQIPSEEILEMAKAINKLQDKFQGLLVQQKA